MAARTLEELREHLLSLGPSIKMDPEEIAGALDVITAAIFAQLEVAIYTLHDRRYIGLADGAWLDEHGRERNRLRFDGESDEDFRQRIKTIEDQVTKPAILARVDEILTVGTARMEEWLPDGAYSDILDVRGFSETSSAHASEPRGFTIYIAEQLAGRSDRGFALDEPADPFETSEGIFHTFAGDENEDMTVTAFADGTDPTPGDIYSRIWNEINRLRAGGLGPPPHFLVEIE